MLSLDSFIFIQHVYYAAVEIWGKIRFTKNKASLINKRRIWIKCPFKYRTRSLCWGLWNSVTATYTQIKPRTVKKKKVHNGPINKNLPFNSLFYNPTWVIFKDKQHFYSSPDYLMEINMLWRWVQGRISTRTLHGVSAGRDELWQLNRNTGADSQPCCFRLMPVSLGLAW